MYLSKLKLTDIKCFGNLPPIEFNNPNNTVPQWTMILGDNSSGKSSILKSIALGLCNFSEGNSIIENVEEIFINKYAKPIKLQDHTTTELASKQYSFLFPKKTTFGSIKITLSDKKEYINVETPIIKNKEGNEIIISQTFDSNIKTTDPYTQVPVHSNRFFLCAYGPNRNVKGIKQFKKDISNYKIRNSTNSLFSNMPEFGSLDLYLSQIEKTSPQRFNHIIKTLKEVFGFNDQYELEITEKGLIIIPSSGKKMELYNLGDGYKATSNWIMDLFGWALVFNDKLKEASNISGIVLIDELEQHLHPKWQREIVLRLRKSFPKIQFITTTHSPLIALSMTDIDNGKLLKCQLDNESGYSNLYEVSLTDIKGVRADEILLSDSFDLTPSTSITFQDDMKKLEKGIIDGTLTDQDINKIKKKWCRISSAENIYDLSNLKKLVQIDNSSNCND